MNNSRRNFIRNSAIASAVVASTPVQSFAILHKDKQPDEQTIGHGGFTYKADKSWAKISVNNTLVHIYRYKTFLHTIPLLERFQMTQD